MGSAITIKIDGWDKIQKGFLNSPKSFVRIFDPAVKKATFILLGKSRERTPIDTGFLRGPGMNTTFDALTGHIGNDAPYASFVHDGTSKMSARPFFEWGIEAGESQVQKTFDEAINQFLQLL